MVGAVMKELTTRVRTNNTIVVSPLTMMLKPYFGPTVPKGLSTGGKGTVLEGGFAYTGHHSSAGIRAGRQGRERNHLRSRLASDVRCCGWESKHPRRVEDGRAIMRSQLRGPCGRLQSPRSHHRTDTFEMLWIFCFAESILGAPRVNDYKYRFIEQPQGAFGYRQAKVFHSDKPPSGPIRSDWHHGSPSTSGVGQNRPMRVKCMRKLPLTGAEDLLEIVMRRYERASTLLTTNPLCGAPHNAECF